MHFDINQYDSSGTYNKSNFIISDYTGDWVVLKLPSPIILSKFNIVARNLNVNRAPAEWKCYGSNNGLTFTEIPDASNLTRLTTSSYSNNIYTKIL